MYYVYMYTCIQYLQICLVSYQHNDDITSSLRPHILYPLVYLLERVGICGGRGRGRKRERKERDGTRKEGEGEAEGEGEERERERGVGHIHIIIQNLTCDVIDYHGNGRVSDIRRD